MVMLHGQVHCAVMNLRTTRCVMGLAALGTFLAFPSTSSADWRRTSGAACTAHPDNLDSSHVVSGTWTVRGGDNITLYCPIQEGNDIDKQDLASIEVNMYDGSSSGGNYGRSYICGRSPYGNEALCLSQTTAGGSGYKQHVLNTDNELYDIADFGRQLWYLTLHVYMQANSSAEQRFMGYYFQS